MDKFQHEAADFLWRKYALMSAFTNLTSLLLGECIPMHSGTALDHRGRLSLVTSHTRVGFPRSTKPSSHEKWQTLPKVRLEDEHCFDPCRGAPGSGHRSTAVKRLPVIVSLAETFIVECRTHQRTVRAGLTSCRSHHTQSLYRKWRSSQGST